ncbi:hypothetical protein QQ045_024445 [Rhodiola kirilowii]
MEAGPNRRQVQAPRLVPRIPRSLRRARTRFQVTGDIFPQEGKVSALIFLAIWNNCVKINVAYIHIANSDLQFFFDKVEVYKPLASRDEIFVLGLKFKALAKIDPHLLDVKHLFESAAVPKKMCSEEQSKRGTGMGHNSDFREIDARPAKKRVAMRKLEKVRRKANTISDQADISDRSKSKMIDQLYKKASPKRPTKEYVVDKKGVQVKTGAGKVLVDRPMKKDMRQHGIKSKKCKGNKGKGAPKGATNKGRRNKDHA